MSEASKAARAAMKSKAKSMAAGSNEKVDASSWEPGQTFSAEKKKGQRPVNPREYKRGGKVVEAMHGEKPGRNVTKMSRHPTHGCRTENKANYEGGTRPTGGRIARKHGGKAGKGKTNINIIIGGGHRDGGAQAAPPPMAPPPQAIRPQGFMPPPGPGGMPPPGAGAPPPMMPPGMGRKSGGRAKSYRDMTAGAASGPGREQKTEIEKSK